MKTNTDNAVILSWNGCNLVDKCTIEGVDVNYRSETEQGDTIVFRMPKGGTYELTMFGKKMTEELQKSIRIQTANLIQ